MRDTMGHVCCEGHWDMCTVRDTMGHVCCEGHYGTRVL